MSIDVRPLQKTEVRDQGSRPSSLASSFLTLGWPANRSLRMAPALLRIASQAKVGGVDRDRTDDLKLAKLALSQLSYDPRCFSASWRQPPEACGTVSPSSPKWATPGSHRFACAKRRLVGPGGVEPPTSRLSGVRSNHLSYEPFSEVREQGSEKILTHFSAHTPNAQASKEKYQDPDENSI